MGVTMSIHNSSFRILYRSVSPLVFARLLSDGCASDLTWWVGGSSLSYFFVMILTASFSNPSSLLIYNCLYANHMALAHSIVERRKAEQAVNSTLSVAGFKVPLRNQNLLRALDRT